MELSLLLLTLGGLLLIGLTVDAIGRMTRLPRITILVGFGVLIGPFGLDLLHVDMQDAYTTVAKIALTMIAFLLGSELSASVVRLQGRAILWVSLSVVFTTVLIIGVGLSALGAPLALALLLAGIGLATDPAAVHDVIKETNSKGPLTKTTLGVVAIDDAWGLIAFSIILGLVTHDTAAGLTSGLVEGLTEIGGAILIGLVIGFPAAFITGRIRSGEPTLIEAAALVLICAGLALWFEVSYLLAGMTAGAVIVNLARHHERAFHEIEYISWPFMIIFFVLAGATADFIALSSVGVLGTGYMVLRIIGRLVGGFIGAKLGGLTRIDNGKWIGLALMPQAGVALGMALVAAEAMPPDIATPLLAIAVGTTIAFELLGPLLTRWVLRAEANR